PRSNVGNPAWYFFWIPRRRFHVAKAGTQVFEAGHRRGRGAVAETSTEVRNRGKVGQDRCGVDEGKISKRPREIQPVFAGREKISVGHPDTKEGQVLASVSQDGQRRAGLSASRLCARCS